MKKIKFFRSDSNPVLGNVDGSGIETKDGRLMEADYYGVVKNGDKSYVITKVVDSNLNSCPNLLGKFIVREAIGDFDIFDVGQVFLDRDESVATREFERFLNKFLGDKKDFDIKTIVDLLDVDDISTKFNYIMGVNDSFDLISIPHEAFRRKKIAIEYREKVLKDISSRLRLKLKDQIEWGHGSLDTIDLNEIVFGASSTNKSL